MSSELESFRRNRINEITNIFNSNVARLNSNLAMNIRSIQISRLRNKQQLINAVINKYNNDINILRNTFNASIQKINSFTTEFAINKNNIKNKKALLIGINYINTPYQLNGCIDDTNRMKDYLHKDLMILRYLQI